MLRRSGLVFACLVFGSILVSADSASCLDSISFLSSTITVTGDASRFLIPIAYSEVECEDLDPLAVTASKDLNVNYQCDYFAITPENRGAGNLVCKVDGPMFPGPGYSVTVFDFWRDSYVEHDFILEVSDATSNAQLCMTSFKVDYSGILEGPKAETFLIPVTYSSQNCGGVIASPSLMDGPTVVASCSAALLVGKSASGGSEYGTSQLVCTPNAYFVSGTPYTLQTDLKDSNDSWQSKASVRYTFRASDAERSCAATVSFASNSLVVALSDDFFYQSEVTYDGQLCDGLSLTPILQDARGNGFEFECQLVSLDAGGYSGLTCQVKTYDLIGERRMAGLIDGIAPTPNGNVFAVTRDEIDAALCGSSFYFPDVQDVMQFDSLDTSLFSTRVTYTTQYCDSTMFADLVLANAEEAYNCLRLTIDGTGQQMVDCSVSVGSMQTEILWSLQMRKDVWQHTKRDTALKVESSREFEVIHPFIAPDPEVSFTRRRQERAERAGIVKPGSFQCRHGLTACKVPGRVATWECIDTMTKLDACGGCPHQGGKDCSEILGVSQVACIKGRCRVSSCDPLHRPSADGQTCVGRKLPRALAWVA